MSGTAVLKLVFKWLMCKGCGHMRVCETKSGLCMECGTEKDLEDE